MSLPSHRHTSSHGGRRRSHSALKATNLVKDKESNKLHRSHRLAPGATEYNGHPVYIKGSEGKIEKLLKKQPKKDEAVKSKKTKKESKETTK